ncbi:MAG: RNA polymerase sigma factor [Planctomycetes bacterium]|nr:RNA polymerase sigma factor [Planctomycetota bacterium]
MDAPDDDELIRRVAEARDQGAFSELYSRHEHAAYSLAVYLTRDAARAEEALQDAMLAVWNDAARYRPGNSRGWLLSIVAQKSIRLKQRQARSEVHMDMATQSENTAARDGSLEGLAHREVLDSLRSLLDKLPERERQLVGLYYAGGLSQDQIAETLRMPQRTVSNRLREILDGLRARLAAQGLAAAAPVLAGSAGGDLLRDAVLTGSPAPKGLAESLAAKTFSATEQSVRAAAAKGGASFIWLAGAVVLAVAGAGGWWYVQPPKNSQSENAQAAPAMPAPPTKAEALPPVPAPIGEKVDLTWDFANSKPKDLTPLLAQWTWAERGPFQRKRAKADGVMLVSAGMRVVVPTHVRIGDAPLRVRVKAVSAVDAGKWMIDAVWADAGGAQAVIPPCDTWRPPTIEVDPRAARTMEIYFHQGYIVQLLDDNRFRQVRKLRNLPDTPLFLYVAFENVAITSIEVQTIETKDLPKPVRNPIEVVKGLGDVPSANFPEMPLSVYYPEHRMP